MQAHPHRTQRRTHTNKVQLRHSGRHFIPIIAIIVVRRTFRRALKIHRHRRRAAHQHLLRGAIRHNQLQLPDRERKLVDLHDRTIDVGTVRARPLRIPTLLKAGVGDKVRAGQIAEATGLGFATVVTIRHRLASPVLTLAHRQRDAGPVRQAAIRIGEVVSRDQIAHLPSLAFYRRSEQRYALGGVDVVRPRRDAVNHRRNHQRHAVVKWWGIAVTEADLKEHVEEAVGQRRVPRLLRDHPE